jgi:hypothetical protein
MLAALQALLTPITWKMETIPFLKGRADGSPRIPAAPAMDTCIAQINGAENCGLFFAGIYGAISARLKTMIRYA